ncbi:MAG: extracellular solute-binding protein [Spirochaetota bacterium]
MKTIRQFVVLLALVLVTAGPAFAGGQQEGGEMEGGAAADAEPVEIRIMGYGGQDPAIVARLLDEVVRDRLADSNIEVTYEPLEGDYNAALFNALSAGTAGDIFYIPVETAVGIIETGKVLPLDDHVDTEPFIESLVEAYTFDGQVYGIAKDFNTLALHYNMDLFDEAGVEYPSDDETWESLTEKVRRVSELGDDIYGISFPPTYDRFGAFAFAAGWEPFDEEDRTDLLDPRFREAVEWYTDLVEEGVAVQPSDLGQGWTGGAFATEQVGIAVEGAWILGFLRNEAPNIRFGTTYMPVGPSGQRGNFLYTVAYGINSDTEHREEAVEVLEALTSDAAQQFVLEEGLAIPSRASLADNPFFDQDTPEATANRVVFEGADMGHVRGYQFGRVGTDWFEPINSALALIMSGEQDLERALGEAQREIDTLIERAE